MSIKVDVACSHVDTTSKTRKAQETAYLCTACSTKYLNVATQCSAAHPGDYVGTAVSVYISCADIHAACKSWRVRKEGSDFVTTISIKDTHLQRRTSIGSHDDVVS